MKLFDKILSIATVVLQVLGLVRQQLPTQAKNAEVNEVDEVTEDKNA